MTRGTGAFQEEETRRANSCARIVVCVNCYESMHMNSMQLTLNLSSQGPQAKKRGLNYLKLNEVLSRTQLSSCFCEHVCKLRSFYVSSCRSLSENIGQKANGQLARKKKKELRKPMKMLTVNTSGTNEHSVSWRRLIVAPVSLC